MDVLTITDKETDTEICVTCPKCHYQDYYDPRPFRHCADCQQARVVRTLVKCPACGDESPSTGDFKDWEWTLKSEEQIGHPINK